MISPEQTSRAARAITRLISALSKFVERFSACAKRQSPNKTLSEFPQRAFTVGCAATPFRFIHDVVVHEGGDMDQLDDHGEIDMLGS